MTLPRWETGDYYAALILYFTGSVFSPLTNTRLHALGLARQFDVFEAFEQFAEERADFHFGEMLAQTQMHAIAERDMAVGLAIHPEGERIGKTSSSRFPEI